MTTFYDIRPRPDGKLDVTAHRNGYHRHIVVERQKGKDWFAFAKERLSRLLDQDVSERGQGKALKPRCGDGQA